MSGKMPNQNRKLTILYGSQTGTSQEIAERIWREARGFHFHGPVKAMDEYPISDLIYENLLVFVCSTSGQGDQPDNMKKFWKFLLRKNLPADSLKNVCFAVLGLGDSSYVKFNHAAKKLYRRLEGLGGQALCEIGLADDQHDLGADAVVDPWLQSLWQVLSSLYPHPPDIAFQDTNRMPLSRWNVEVTDDGSSNTPGLLNWKDNTSTALVLSNERITHTEHFQDVRLLKLQGGFNYNPGDVVMIRPQNLSEPVQHLLEILNKNAVCPLQPETKLKVMLRDADMPVPPALCSPFTLLQCAQQYWDLNAVPKRYTLQLLCQFTTSELEREKLAELTSAEGQADLYKYCNRPKRTVLEVLSDFPHAAANLPLPYFFDIFHPIRQRAFSIASSPSAHAGEVHILLAVVKYKTSLYKPRVGLCSNWLASLQVNASIPVSIRKGSFTFPLDMNVPMLMVGPGTGVAPFRSVIQERAALGSANKHHLLLVFGNRNKEADFHISQEWKSLEDTGRLTLLTAFSRDQPHKIYVQHVIHDNHKLIFSWLKRKCWIYVAGNANNMPTAVRSAFITVVENEGGLSTKDAEQFIQTMETEGRYQTETWS